MNNPYETLGVSPEADEVVIEAAYQALVKEHHPDAGGDAESFDQIKTAYDTIMSDGQKAEKQYSSKDTFSGFVEGLQSLGTPVSSSTVEGTLSSGLVIEKGPLKITLLSLFRTDIAELVYDHAEEGRETKNRFISVFRVENTSNYVEKWRPNEAVYVDDNGLQYSDASAGFLAINDQSPLPSRFTAQGGEIEPGAYKIGVSVPEPIEIGSSVDRVVYKHEEFAGDQTDGVIQHRHRFVFDITPSTQAQMRKLLAKELPQDARSTVAGELQPVEDGTGNESNK